MLRIEGQHIVGSEGQKVRLTGIAIGGWLMMEGYILGGRNIAERAFKKDLAQKQGKQALKDFTRLFRNTFVQEDLLQQRVIYLYYPGYHYEHQNL